MLEMTIKELQFVFDVIFDAQEHPIFCDENGDWDENALDRFGSYNAAFGAWIAYELQLESK